MLRSALARNAHVRLLSTTTRLQKGPIEVAKDAVKTVDRTVSDAAVAGIEAGGTCHAASHRIAVVTILQMLMITQKRRRRRSRKPLA